MIPFFITGKERDTESGLDYFGARYYSSSMGRWMSPDWSAKEKPVPYAKLDDPQSLNLYGYVRNNPLSRVDPDGHCWPFCLAPVGGGAIISTLEGFSAAISGPVAAGVAAFSLGVQALASDADQAYFANGGGFNTAGAPMSVMSLVKQEDGAKSIPNPNGRQMKKQPRWALRGNAVRVQTPGGGKGSQVIDAAKKDANGNITEATQVVRTNKNGTPKAREVRAARDIQKATGVQPKLVPVRPIKDPQ